MRKIYFLIFGIVLVALILLVDWREKFQQITHSQPGERLGQILSSPPEAAATLREEEPSGEAIPNETFPEVAPMELPYEDPAAAELTPAGDPGFGGLQVSPSRAARPPAASRPPMPQPFQDLPEQPYLDESRRVLRNTLANYHRISPPAPQAKPERRP
jgi:hypothetical protein